MLSLIKFRIFAGLGWLLSLSAFAQTNLDVNAFEGKLNSTPQVLDVRTASEYERGYLPNAKNIDWKKQDTFAEQVSKLDKSKPVLVYCYSGGRSGQAAEYLAKAGFKEVYNLDGGYLKWTNANKSVIAPTERPAMMPAPKGKDVLAQTLKDNKVVLVDFYAVWCAPCKQQAPILEKLKHDWAGKVSILKIDADRDPDLVKQYKVDAIPTLILFKDGKPVDRMIGFQDEASLRKDVEKTL